MRVLLLFGLLAVLATTVLAWTKEDHEIFDLVSELEAAEGKKTTFYSWLDVPDTASTAEIARAYRKKSMLLHPDKNPGVKGIHERFARLGVISSILRNTEGRKRYDFFYKNGVPRWRGTGYYYSRFRPGLGTVLVFLTMLTSVLQYMVQSMNYKKDTARIEHVVREAKLNAWGQKMVPIEGRRKVKVNLGGPPRLDDSGNVVLGKSIDMVVETVQGTGHVYMVEPGGDMILIDASTATPPSFKRTWFISLATSLYHKAYSRLFPPNPKSNGRAEPSEGDEGESTGVETESDMLDSDVPETNGGARASAVKVAGNGNGNGKKRKNKRR